MDMELFILSNGLKYVGEFKDGNREGYGTAFDIKGTPFYIGEWKDDKFNGYGFLNLGPEGSKIGEWKDGKLHGHELTFPKLEESYWVNGKMVKNFMDMELSHHQMEVNTLVNIKGIITEREF